MGFQLDNAAICVCIGVLCGWLCKILWMVLLVLNATLR
jgi:hypothetical protein